MKTPKKEVRIAVRVTSDIKNKLELLAQANKRSFSDFLRLELENIVNQNKGIFKNVTLKDGKEERQEND